jgi:hypothetical protein
MQKLFQAEIVFVRQIPFGLLTFFYKLDEKFFHAKNYSF